MIVVFRIKRITPHEGGYCSFSTLSSTPLPFWGTLEWLTLSEQARYIPFFNVRQYTQINVYFIKEYGIVPIAYGCTEIRSQNDLIEAKMTRKAIVYYMGLWVFQCKKMQNLCSLFLAAALTRRLLRGLINSIEKIWNFPVTEIKNADLSAAEYVGY